MTINTRSSNLRSTVSGRRLAHIADENSLANGASAASRTTRAKSALQTNTASAAAAVASAKSVNNAGSRSALTNVSAANANAQKFSNAATASSKPGVVSKTASTTSQNMAAVASRKTRAPLSAVDSANAGRPQVYRDPAPRPTRPKRAAAAAADNAIHAVLAGKSTNAIATAGTHHQPAKILRSQSASNAPPPPSTRTELGTSTAAKASCAQAASGEPLSLAGRKRRASSAEPAAATRAVRAKVAAVDGAGTKGVVRPQSAATGEPSAFPPSSSSSAESCADSQATVVESEQQQQQKPPALAHRKIAKPSRTFASLHSNLGPSPFDIEVARPEPACDWDNIDADDADDPLMVSEYISDIIDYLRKLEQKTMPDETYMGKQVELSWEMRRVLVNWLIQIHYQLRMLPETLFLAVNLVDRFLSKRQVSVSKLQLVGLSGLLVACKYEEMTTPHIQDFAYLAGNCYSVEEIMNAEVFMLRVLDFDMSYPSPLTFLRRVSKAEQYNMQTRTVAKYLMEICLVDHRLMPFSPSLIAAAGICLARRMLKAGPWDANLRHYSGYTEEELQPCMRLILDHMQHMNEEDFLFKKYQHRRFLKASLFCREWISRHRHELQPISPPIGNFASSSASGGAF